MIGKYSVEILGFGLSDTEQNDAESLRESMKSILNSTQSQQDGKMLGEKTDIAIIFSSIESCSDCKSILKIRIIANNDYAAHEINQAFRYSGLKINGEPLNLESCYRIYE